MEGRVRPKQLKEEEEEEEGVRERERQECKVLAERVRCDRKVARLAPENWALGAKEVERHLDRHDRHRQQRERERLRVPHAHAHELIYLDHVHLERLIREEIGKGREELRGAEPGGSREPRALFPQLLPACGAPIVRVRLSEVELVPPEWVLKLPADERA